LTADTQRNAARHGGPEDGPRGRPQWSRRPQAALEMVKKVLTDCYGSEQVCV
jgi:hypothetical protein